MTRALLMLLCALCLVAALAPRTALARRSSGSRSSRSSGRRAPAAPARPVVPALPAVPAPPGTVSMPGGAPLLPNGFSLVHQGMLDGKVVVLDPGHGGSASGATAGGGLRESDLNLWVARELREYLVRAGATVVMTRVGDTDCLMAKPFVLREDLVTRAQVSNDLEADLFLSCHHNDAPNRMGSAALSRWNRTEIYYRMDDEGASRAFGDAVFGSLTPLLLSPRSQLIPGAFAVLRFNRRPAVLGEPFYIGAAGLEKLARTPTFAAAEATRYLAGILDYLTAAYNAPQIVRPIDGEIVDHETFPVRITFDPAPRVVAPTIPPPVPSTAATTATTVTTPTAAAPATTAPLNLFIAPPKPAPLSAPPTLVVTVGGRPLPVTVDARTGRAWARLAGIPNGPVLLEATLVGPQGRAAPVTRRRFRFEMPPARIEARASPPEVDPAYAGPTVITATVTDARGMPVADGTPVRISLGGQLLATARTTAGVMQLTVDPASPAPPSTAVPAGPTASVAPPPAPVPSASPARAPGRGRNERTDGATTGLAITSTPSAQPPPGGASASPPAPASVSAPPSSSTSASAAAPALAFAVPPRLPVPPRVPAGPLSFTLVAGSVSVPVATARRAAPVAWFAARVFDARTRLAVPNLTAQLAAAPATPSTTRSAPTTAVGCTLDRDGGNLLLAATSPTVSGVELAADGYIPLSVSGLALSVPGTRKDIAVAPVLEGVLHQHSVVFDAEPGSETGAFLRAATEIFRGTGVEGAWASWDGIGEINDQVRARAANKTPAEIAVTVMNGIGGGLSGPVDVQYYHASERGKVIAASIADAFRRYYPSVGARSRIGGSYFLNNTRATTLALSFGGSRKGGGLPHDRVAYIVMHGLMRAFRPDLPRGRTIAGKAPAGVVPGTWMILGNGDRCRLDPAGQYTFLDVPPGRYTVWFQAEPPDRRPAERATFWIDVP